MSFFVKAAVEALRAFPAVNAEVRGDAVLYKDHYDVGVAVGGGKGLVVPVVRDADVLSFAEIEKAIADLAKKAKENRLGPGRPGRRHLHHLQRRRLRLAPLHAHPQPARSPASSGCTRSRSGRWWGRGTRWWCGR